MAKAETVGLMFDESEPWVPAGWWLWTDAEKADWVWRSHNTMLRSQWVKFVAELCFGKPYSLREDDVQKMTLEKNELVRELASMASAPAAGE